MSVTVFAALGGADFLVAENKQAEISPARGAYYISARLEKVGIRFRFEEADEAFSIPSFDKRANGFLLAKQFDIVDC